MKLHDNNGLIGRLQISRNGVVILDKKNLIVTTGKDLSASRLMSNSDNFIDHMGIGSDVTPPAVGNLALGNQLARVSTTNTRAGSVAKWEATFVPTVGTGTITEAGLFNAAVAGFMMSRITFAAIPKLDADELKFTWTIETQV